MFTDVIPIGPFASTTKSSKELNCVLPESTCPVIDPSVGSATDCETPGGTTSEQKSTAMHNTVMALRIARYETGRRMIKQDQLQFLNIFLSKISVILCRSFLLFHIVHE